MRSDNINLRYEKEHKYFLGRTYDILISSFPDLWLMIWFIIIHDIILKDIRTRMRSFSVFLLHSLLVHGFLNTQV